jgi:hypothetical protein
MQPNEKGPLPTKRKKCHLIVVNHNANALSIVSPRVVLDQHHLLNQLVFDNGGCNWRNNGNGKKNIWVNWWKRKSNPMVRVVVAVRVAIVTVTATATATATAIVGSVQKSHPWDWSVKNESYHHRPYRFRRKVTWKYLWELIWVDLKVIPVVFL